MSDGGIPTPPPPRPKSGSGAGRAPRPARTAHARRRTPWASVLHLLRSIRISVSITALVAIAGVFFTGFQACEARQEYFASSQASRYKDIVADLANPSATVQINAVDRLVDFVEDPDNFSDRDQQQVLARELERTLSQYIVSTAGNTASGLKSYRAPAPTARLAESALSQLLDSLNVVEPAKDQLSSIDLSHADLHGYSRSGLVLRRNLLLVGADLREAVLPGLDVGTTGAVDLTDADLTCADLNSYRDSSGVLHQTRLRGDISAADLTGANLTGADLSEVTGLSSAQVQHTIFDATTKWPTTWSDGSAPPRLDPLQNIRGMCTYVVNSMTGLVPGEGYEPSTPWPAGSPASVHVVQLVRDPTMCLVPQQSKTADPRVVADPTGAAFPLAVRRC